MSKILVALTLLIVCLALPVLSQQQQQQPLGQCTPTMMTTVAPCMSFLTNSTSNGTSPTTDCCNSLRSLTTGGMGCLCLIVTGTVPFNIPVNRTTAVSLPRACNMPSVPLQCKANISPASAPGPAATFGPALSPGSGTTPVAQEPTPATETPQSDATRPFTPPDDGGSPTVNTGGSNNGPSQTPSSAYALSPSLLFFSIGLIALKFY
ncbi:unnamed protein product [Cochlearia groenlandica]